MKHWHLVRFLLILIAALPAGCGPNASQDHQASAAASSVRPAPKSPRIVGAMRNVMWKGELFARIDFDTLTRREHLYGLGPIEGLQGEFMVFNGEGYKATVVNDAPYVEQTFAIRAPFAGYDYIGSWQPVALADSVRTIEALDRFLDALSGDSDGYFFRIEAAIDSAKYHIMALPSGTEVSSPDDAHTLGRRYFSYSGAADLLGFYSTQHAGVFTHHDTHTHIHILSADRAHLGHLDDLVLSPGGHTLYLPSHLRKAM